MPCTINHPRRALGALLLVLASAIVPRGLAAQTPHPNPKPAAPAASLPADEGGLAKAALDAAIAKHHVPGMAVAVIRGDRVVRLAAAGVRAAGHPEAVTTSDLWHIGSCTKAMTATLCAILVEKRVLRWDVTLAEALPDMAPSMDEGFRRATLAQLCANRAGVPGDLSPGGLWRRLGRAEGTPTEQRRLLAEGVLTRPPSNLPGTKFEYANAGFAIAGYICERTAGESYESLMAQHLFAPLGMTTCGWGAPGTPAEPGHQGEPAAIDQPRGHAADGKPRHPTPSTSGVGADNPIAISPAGRLHCSIEDWARFASLHLRGHARNPHRDCRLLPPAAFDRLHTPPDDLDPYALGWVRTQRAWAGPEGDRWVLTHSGSNTMWFAVAWLAPAQDLAVLVCCNQAGPGTKACDDVAAAMIKAHASGR